MMPLQRVRVAEQSNVNSRLTEYSATCGHTSVAGDMLVSC